MFKRALFSFAGIILSLGCVYAAALPPDSASKMNALAAFQGSDRVLVVAPHPDDETIGCAGIIQQALATGAQVRVVYMTNGDHNQVSFIIYKKRLIFRQDEFIHMGRTRRQEAINAMKLLGLEERNLVFLGYPDFGTFTIFSQYWQSKVPFRSLLTRISFVPYKENLTFGAPYKAESMLDDFKKVIFAYKPNKIFVTHSADVNADHRAAYLFLQIALSDLEGEIPAPQVYPYLIHCVGWPSPRDCHPELGLEPPAQFLDSQISWSSYELTPEQLKKKHQAVLCYKSQTEYSAFYLLSFVRKNELFGEYAQIQLEKQKALRDRAISFFGSLDMFNSSDQDELKEESIDLPGGHAQISYAVVDDNFLIHVTKSAELNRRFSLMLYLFGYNYKIPFSQMPKIHIISKYNKFKVFDGRKLLNSSGVTLQLDPNVLTLSVPLKLLGGPDFILTSVKAYGDKTRSEKVPVDAIGFRKIFVE